MWNLLFQNELETLEVSNWVFANDDTSLYTANGALSMTSETAGISCLRLSAFLTAGESRDEPAAETQISDVDGRRDEETRRWIRVHYQDAERKKKSFFQHFSPPSGARAACVRSRLKCINTLTSKTIRRCLHARAIRNEKPGYYQAQRLSINQPAQQDCKQTSGKACVYCCTFSKWN